MECASALVLLRAGLGHSMAENRIEDGEILVSIACGGGGYGDPKTRDPKRVLHDVREGLVSRNRAEEVYGIAITDSMEIDETATQSLRA